MRFDQDAIKAGSCDKSQSPRLGGRGAKVTVTMGRGGQSTGAADLGSTVSHLEVGSGDSMGATLPALGPTCLTHRLKPPLKGLLVAEGPIFDLAGC